MGDAKSEIVRAALVQSKWTGDKESMIEANVALARRAADQGAQVLCFQELFYGPYFCQVQDPEYFSYTESIPGRRPSGCRSSRARPTWCSWCRSTRVEQEGVFYNTAFVIDADGTYLGKYRKHHIPQVKGFWEKYYFRPGNLGYPVFQTAVGPIGVYICYDRHFPEGWRALGLAGARIVFNPSATSRGLSAYLWNLEQPAAAVANEYFVGAINRVGVEELGDNNFYGSSYFVTPGSDDRRGRLGQRGRGDRARPRHERLKEVRHTWAFYRDRRPDSYGDLVTPSDRRKVHS